MVPNNLNAVNAVGVWFYSISTQRYLYLMRNDEKHPQCWGLPGGKMDPGETLMSSLIRECTEELGLMPEYIKLLPLEKFTSVDNVFAYHTFFCSVVNEFQPTLNDEHIGWAWINSGVWPKPLHPGLWSTVNLEAIQTKISVIQQQFNN